MDAYNSITSTFLPKRDKTSNTLKEGTPDTTAQKHPISVSFHTTVLSCGSQTTSQLKSVLVGSPDVV